MENISYDRQFKETPEDREDREDRKE